MKCQFCGRSAKKLYSGPNDIALCEECYNAYEANKTKEDTTVGEVIEMKNGQTEEVNEAVQAPESPIRCEIAIGVMKDGGLYFNVAGEGADLLVIDGLLKYAERRMKQQWDIRDMEIAKATAQALAPEANTDE